MNLSEDIIHGKVCPVCGKPINFEDKDSFYDAYRYDGVILNNKYSVMVEDHGPHLRFHHDCTLGIKDNGNGFWDIVIDKDKYWDKDTDADYIWWLNRDIVKQLDVEILSQVSNQYPHYKCKIEEGFEDFNSRLVTIYGIKPKKMIEVENKLWDIIDNTTKTLKGTTYIPSVVSLRNTKELFPDMMPAGTEDTIITKIKCVFQNIKDWFDE